jgi:hypothetical protein
MKRCAALPRRFFFLDRRKMNAARRKDIMETNPYRSPLAESKREQSDESRPKRSSPWYSFLFFLIAGVVGLRLGGGWIYQYALEPRTTLTTVVFLLGIAAFVPSVYMLWFALAIWRSYSQSK